MRLYRAICLAALLLGLLLAPPAEAGDIRLTVAVTPRLSQGMLKVRVKVSNKGGEAATNLLIAARSLRHSTEMVGADRLEPGASATRELVLPFIARLPGTYGVLVRVVYHDVNGYPLSAVSWGLFHHKRPTVSGVKLRGINGRPWPGLPPSFLLSNDQAGERKVSLEILAPAEMVPAQSSWELDLAPGEKRRLRVEMTNRGGLEGSAYPVAALAGYVQGGRHYATAGMALVRIVPLADALARWRGWLWALAGLLLALIVAAWVIQRRRRPAAGSDMDRSIYWELGLVGACCLYVLAHLAPHLLLTDTVTAGGDTGSHVYTAWYLKNVLLPSGRILGWCPGNLAGYPIFQFYFPLPFLGMVALSWLAPLNAAFKLVTVGGGVLMPLACWLGLRLARAPRPAPALGAVFSLLFLFNETSSTFGGNLPSLLAGEFTYSYSLALLVVFMGAVAGDLNQRRHPVRAALLLAATGLCHGGPLLFGVLAGGTLLFSREAVGRALYLGKVYALAFAFMGFWIVPLLVFSPYNSPHNMVWIISKWQTVLPPLLWPLMALALAGFILALVQRIRGKSVLGEAAFFGGQVVLASLLYMVAFHINVIDIRFFPFAWLSITLWAAWVLAVWLGRLPAKGLAALLVLVLVVLGVGGKVVYIPRWAAWNYSGFPAAPGWEGFHRLNKYLKGSQADPRVAYEHSPLNRRAGTVRAMESLPLFSGRSTLEGLYIQSSPNSPYIFYLQSLLCTRPSTPITGYNYAGFDLDRGLARLDLFNVGQYVTISRDVRLATLRHRGFTPQAALGPYHVFAVPGGGEGYVTPLKYKPVLVTEGNWKYQAFDWFRGDELEVPLVFAPRDRAGDLSRFAAVGPRPPDKLPRSPLPLAKVGSRVGWQEIEITTDSRTPLLVKMSYHPNWQVEGAKRVFLASPAFMIIFPTQDKVRLYFGQSWPNYLGQVLFVLACLAGFLCLPGVRRMAWAQAARGAVNRPLGSLVGALDTVLARPLAWCSRRSGVLALAGLLVVAGGAGAYVGLGLKADATVAFNRGIAAYNDHDYQRAAELFADAARRFPRSLIIDHTLNHQAMSLYLLERYAEAKAVWAGLLARLPETRLKAQTWYHLGLADQRLGHLKQARRWWQRVVNEHPKHLYAKHARARLKETAPPGPKNP